MSIFDLIPKKGKQSASKLTEEEAMEEARFVPATLYHVVQANKIVLRHLDKTISEQQTADLTPITQRLDTIEKALGAILSHLETDMELQGMEKEVLALLKKDMEKRK